ncbi:hypothetical protein JOD24_000184 [Kroppenstedtia sanguinis]
MTGWEHASSIFSEHPMLRLRARGCSETPKALGDKVLRVYPKECCQLFDLKMPLKSEVFGNGVWITVISRV